MLRTAVCDCATLTTSGSPALVARNNEVDCRGPFPNIARGPRDVSWEIVSGPRAAQVWIADSQVDCRTLGRLWGIILRERRKSRQISGMGGVIPQSGVAAIRWNILGD